MPINPVQKPKGSPLLGFIGDAVGNVVTGGAKGLAGKALGGVNDLFKAADANLPDSTPAVAAPKEPEVGREAIPDEAPQAPLSAMGRRMENDPSFALHAGLEALHDPSLQLSHDTGMAVLEPLMRAKHFGKGGGLP